MHAPYLRALRSCLCSTPVSSRYPIIMQNQRLGKTSCVNSTDNFTLLPLVGSYLIQAHC